MVALSLVGVVGAGGTSPTHLVLARLHLHHADAAGSAIREVGNSVAVLAVLAMAPALTPLRGTLPLTLADAARQLDCQAAWKLAHRAMSTRTRRNTCCLGNVGPRGNTCRTLRTRILPTCRRWLLRRPLLPPLPCMPVAAARSSPPPPRQFEGSEGCLGNPTRVLQSRGRSTTMRNV